MTATNFSTDYSAASDDSLLAAVAATGSVAAFETLVERFSGRVYALVVRIVGVAADAEEIVQDTMMRVYEHAGRFSGRSAVGSWIFRIAYNMAIDSTRRSARLAETALPDNMAETEAADNSGSDPRLAALDRAMAALPPADRALLTLHYFDGRPLAEVAEIAGMTLSNVKVRMMRLRSRLRDSISTSLETDDL